MRKHTFFDLGCGTRDDELWLVEAAAEDAAWDATPAMIEQGCQYEEHSINTEKASVTLHGGGVKQGGGVDIEQVRRKEVGLLRAHVALLLLHKWVDAAATRWRHVTEHFRPLATELVTWGGRVEDLIEKRQVVFVGVVYFQVVHQQVGRTWNITSSNGLIVPRRIREHTRCISNAFYDIISSVWIVSQPIEIQYTFQRKSTRFASLCVCTPTPLRRAHKIQYTYVSHSEQVLNGELLSHRFTLNRAKQCQIIDVRSWKQTLNSSTSLQCNWTFSVRLTKFQEH